MPNYTRFICQTCDGAFLKQKRKGTTNVECKKCGNKRRVTDWKAANRDLVNAKERDRIAREKARGNPRIDNWQKNNPEKVAAKAARWRAANPERNKEIDAAFRDRHRDRLRIQWGVRRHKKKLLWSSGEDVAVFYESAKRLSECFGVPFEVDHILPLKGRKVSGLHVVENLQVITMVANRRKQNKVFA